MNDRSEYAPKTGGRTPTHDQICTFDPKYCRDCQLQAEARADEREQAAQRVGNAPHSGGPLGNAEMYRSDAVYAARGGEQA